MVQLIRRPHHAKELRYFWEQPHRLCSLFSDLKPNHQVDGQPEPQSNRLRVDRRFDPVRQVRGVDDLFFLEQAEIHIQPSLVSALETESGADQYSG